MPKRPSPNEVIEKSLQINKLIQYYDNKNKIDSKENIQELISVKIASDNNKLNTINLLEDFLTKIAINNENHNKNEQATDKVELMTIHLAKA